jgi:HEAT repeat protein
MPREQLAALTADVDRLLAAGAAAAVGNDSLRRRAKTLGDMGQKIAALNPVAEAVNRVTQASPNQAAPALLDLVVMCRQIRASLSSSGVPGELESLSESGPWRTPLPVRDVQPLVEALTKSGPGREDLLKSAQERNGLADLRLVSGLLEALDDGYGPIAELVAREALPALGRAVLPDLISGFNLQGKTADARRLLAICRIDASTGAALCRRALSEGSQTVRVQALERLPDVAPVEEAEQSGLVLRLDKNRDIRAAAVWSLRTASSDQVLEALIEALVSDSDEQVQRRAADALAFLRNPRTTQRLLEVLESRLAGEPEQSDAPKRRGKKTTPPGDARSEHLRTTSLVIEALGSRRDKQRGVAAERLLPLARGKEPTLRVAALAALGGIGPLSRDIVPTLTEAIRDKNDLVASAAVQALSRFTPAERTDVWPALREVLSNPKVKNQPLRASVVSLLPDYMDRYGKAILDLISKLLMERDPYIQSSTHQALAKIGLAARSLLPDLLAHCKRNTGYLHANTGSALAALDPEGKTAVPELIKLLDERNTNVRCTALQLLAHFGASARAAAPLVTKLCDDKDYTVRYWAERTLPAIQ